MTTDLEAIAESIGTTLDDVEQAFRQVRPHVETDAQACDVLRDVGRGHPPGAVARRDAEAAARGWTRRGKAKPGGRLQDLVDGPVHVFPSRSIRVEGGTGPKLPPASRELDGTPDPEIGRAMAEGAVRYHLDSLRELAAADEETLRSFAAAPARPVTTVERRAEASVPELLRSIGIR